MNHWAQVDVNCFKYSYLIHFVHSSLIRCRTLFDNFNASSNYCTTRKNSFETDLFVINLFHSWSLLIYRDVWMEHNHHLNEINYLIYLFNKNNTHIKPSRCAKSNLTFSVDAYEWSCSATNVSLTKLIQFRTRRFSLVHRKFKLDLFIRIKFLLMLISNQFHAFAHCFYKWFHCVIRWTNSNQ